MNPAFDVALKFIWGLFAVYWLWSARHVKSAVLTEPVLTRFLMYWLPLIAAILLLGPGPWFGHSLLREQFVPHSLPVQSLGLALALAGVLLACWSRHLLGSNWSSVVQVKQGHELIEHGPYRHVRHPIYAGLLLLFLGNALLVGDWRGLLAVAIVFASFWRKLRLEERWLAQHFGPPYLNYLKRTKALIPGIL